MMRSEADPPFPDRPLEPAADPFALFRTWFEEARLREPGDPDAMALATVGPDARPSLRMVLLKDAGPDGFAFFTNLDSRKARELAAHPQAALCFHWKSVRRQVRIEGRVGPVPAAEADAYFASRARGSRIGAWASRQSRPVSGRAELERRVSEAEARFADGDIPRPPHWSGFRLVPDRFEFWQERLFRLHDRLAYERPAGPAAPWRQEWLYP